MSLISERMLHIARVHAEAEELGPQVTRFLSECIKAGHTVGAFADAAANAAKATGQTRAMEMMLDHFSDHFLSCTIAKLRYLLDMGMATNETRLRCMRPMIVAISGCPWDEADSIIEEHGGQPCGGLDCPFDSLLTAQTN